MSKHKIQWSCIFIKQIIIYINIIQKATTKTGGVVYTTDRPSMCAKNQSSTTVAQGGSGTLEMIPEGMLSNFAI